MNLTEQQLLINSRISHISRSLYAFYLRLHFEQGENHIDLISVCNYLYTESQYFPTHPDFNIANICLNELEEAGLIKKESNIETSSWQGVQYSLPAYVSELSSLPRELYPMTLEWRPSPNFHDAAVLCGLVDSTFTEKELKAFTSYWSGRGDMRNSAAWDRAFALRLLKSRVAKVGKNKAGSADAAAEKGRSETVDDVLNEQKADTDIKYQKQMADELKNMFS
ncbi:MAG: DnaT-like ssDNA-binding domain-containing protein [Succinivibrio sp.]